MTHLSELRGLLDKMGVVYTTGPSGVYHKDPAIVTVLTIESGTGPKNKGYSGFYTEYLFDASEVLIAVGVWE